VGVYRRAFDAIRAARPALSWDELCRLAAGTDEGRRGLAAWRKARRLLSFPAAKRAALASLLARHRDRRTLVFVADNDAAYRIAREHLVMPITCDVSRGERQAAIDAFAEGRLRALVSSQVLNEGLDVPGADVGVIVGGRLGGREHVQRIGRVLRPAEGKRAIVYELVVQGTAEVRQAERRSAPLAPRERSAVAGA
jgi:superfamily II DNA or RNA helicase